MCERKTNDAHCGSKRKRILTLSDSTNNSAIFLWNRFTLDAFQFEKNCFDVVKSALLFSCNFILFCVFRFVLCRIFRNLMKLFTDWGCLIFSLRKQKKINLSKLQSLWLKWMNSSTKTSTRMRTRERKLHKNNSTK